MSHVLPPTSQGLKPTKTLQAMTGTTTLSSGGTPGLIFEGKRADYKSGKSIKSGGSTNPGLIFEGKRADRKSTLAPAPKSEKNKYTFGGGRR